MHNIFNKGFLYFGYLLFFTSVSYSLPGKAFESNPDTIFVKHDSIIDKQRLSFETEEIEASDQIITDHLIERFPIISKEEINKIVLNKAIVEKFQLSTDSQSTSAAKPVYKVTFEVQKNFLVDTAKILWELNIPEFQSHIYQLFNGQQIYIDTWPNVVGTSGSKTYTGNFQAYRIRNWPFYKDPEPSKSHLSPTKPGPGNPLGLFVVHYDENSLRYFHGTDKPKLLNNKMRNLSHGCVRNNNDNIEKMKEFIIKRIVKSKDLSSWLGSKKTLIYDFEEIDKFPVKIIYKTFDINKDALGNYIIFFKDIYNYKNSNNINSELNDLGLITLTNKENIVAEYKKKFSDNISEDALDFMINYLIDKGQEYEKYYIDELKQKFFIQN